LQAAGKCPSQSHKLRIKQGVIPWPATNFMKQEVCGHCKFYRSGSGPTGQCWHSPPTPYIAGRTKEGNLVVNAMRAPVAGNTEACGQFDKKFLIEPIGTMPNGSGN
jgi:hypothetical protein